MGEPAQQSLQLALRYAEAGYKLLPLHTSANGKCSCGKPECPSQGKHPRTPKGAYDSSASADTISQWLKRWPDANLGMTLEGLVVIDVDPRHNGHETLEAIVEKHGQLPDTWTQQTGGGGRHYVYKADPKAKYAGHLGAGLDLKHGAGQFIVVEPSKHASGGQYNWLDESGPLDGSPIADAPQWLATAGAASGSVVVPGPNSDKVGSGQRNTFLYERARRLRDLSFRQPEIYTALTALNTRCVPPLTDDELFTISKSASQNDPAPDDIADQFVDGATFVTDITPPVWLVDGIIQRSYLYALTAQPNHGKTALATLLALCVSQGRPFGSANTEEAHVLYLCGENPDDFKIRLRAVLDELQLKPKDIAKNFTVLPITKGLPELYEKIVAKANAKAISLIIIDTSVAYFNYDDENANQDIKLHAQDMRNLISVNGSPAILTLCHPTKNADRENLKPRGGGAMYAEIDGNLTAWKDDDTVELHHTKTRGPSFEPILFRLHKVEPAGVFDARGRPVITVLARPISEQEARDAARSGISDVEALVQAMRYEENASLAEWAARCGWNDKNGMPMKSKVHRILAKLKAEHFAKQELGTWKLTQKGQDLAKSVVS